MQFEEARKKLKKIARGEYCSISFACTEYDNRTIQTDCRIYIHGEDGYRASTFKEAFAVRERAIKPVEVEEIPQHISAKEGKK